jgi:transcriptional regulator with XRE-family HTH domain
MTRMGVAAVGAYFKTLADIQPGSMPKMVENLGIQAKYIWRLENNKIKEPSAKLLRLITESLRGSWEDVGALLTDDKAEPSDGRARALAWALRAGLVKETDRAILERATADELRQAADHLRRLADDR